MSNYQANIITKSPAAPRGPVANGAAPGMWRLDEVAYWVKQGVWPNPSLIPDPYFPYVSLLLSTTSLTNANNNMFVDSSGVFNPIKRNGNTTQGSFTPYSTNWSNYFDGSGDYLYISSNAAFGFGAGDYTVECWTYCDNKPGSNSYDIVDFRTTGTQLAPIIAIRSDADSNAVAVLLNGSWVITGASFAFGQWNHIALTRSGTSTKLFVNGTQTGSTYTDNNTYVSSAPCSIGAYQPSPSNTEFKGFISNVRVVKGTAVYTSNFTPPTFALTAISGTSLLTCQSNRFRDASSNNFAITRNGNTLVTDFNPFLSTAPITYNQSDISNLSAYFAGGTDDWLSVPANTALAFGTGDFCMEAWVFCENRSSYRAVMTVIGAVSIVIYGGATMLVLDRTSGAALLSDTSSFPLNQWVHVACSRQSGTMRLFINGELRASATVTTSFSSTDKTYIASWDGFNFRWVGNISNARIVKGAAVYTSAFTPPSAPLTAISGTSLLTCQSPNNFIDNSTNNFPVTVSGFTTVTGNTPFNTVGFWSNYFDGSGDYLTTPSSSAFNLSSGDFTVEFFLYKTVDKTCTYMSGNEHDWRIEGVSNGTVYYVAQNTALINPATVLALNAWHHIALVKSGATTTLYLNGIASGTTTTNPANSNAITYIGINPANSAWAFQGYMSNSRIVKGTAVYTSNFTPPTTPLTAITNTQLLTCQNGRFIDNSTNNFTITVNGDTATPSFNPFYTSTIASNGGSMYFDGTGDYLDIPTLAGLGGSGNFTIQAWIYPTTVAGDCCIYETRGGSGWVWFINSTGYLQVFDSSAGLQTASTTQLVAYQWTHIALVKNGSTCTYYVNGSAAGTFTLATFQSPSQIRIGARNDAAAAYFGWISGLKTDPAALTISLPTAPQNPSNNTTLLVNGMNAGIYDATAISEFETFGNPQVSTVQSKFGGSSIYFDGSDDVLAAPPSPDLDFGTGDFTIEMWVRPSNFSGSSGRNGLIMRRRTDTVGTGAWAVYLNGSGNLLFQDVESGTVIFTSSGALTTNTWQHIAVTRSGSTVRGFINGVLDGSGTSTRSFTNTWYLILGMYDTSGGSWPSGSRNSFYTGWMDDVRITRGIARYTANFTPPTQAFPAL